MEAYFAQTPPHFRFTKLIVKCSALGFAFSPSSGYEGFLFPLQKKSVLRWRRILDWEISLKFDSLWCILLVHKHVRAFWTWVKVWVVQSPSSSKFLNRSGCCVKSISMCFVLFWGERGNVARKLHLTLPFWWLKEAPRYPASVHTVCVSCLPACWHLMGLWTLLYFTVFFCFITA